MARLAAFLLPCAVIVGAVALRLPYLLEVPGFTDEAIDIKVALDILDGQWPLVDAEPYIGSLFNYLLAGGFLLLGREAYVPRLVVTAFGVLTVVLTYFLGRTLGGRVAGLVAAALLATSGTHIANGHIAWSNCVTPFFTTAAMLALVQAARRANGPLLVLAGALFGLAVQTHASAAFLAPALVAHLLLTSPTRAASPGRPRISDIRRTIVWWLRRPWPYLALLASILAISNVIAFNLLNPGAWEVAARQKEYAYVESPDLGIYLTNLDALVAALVRMAASSFEGGPSLRSQLAMTANLPYAVALVVGAGYAAWRRQALMLVGIGVTALALPYMNRNYDFPIGVRYLGYLLPLLALLIALPLGHAVEALWQRARHWAVVPALCAVLLTVLPIGSLFTYYDSYLRISATSPTILALQEEIQAKHRAGLVSDVFLDPQLEWIYTAPGGRVSRAFDLLFTIGQVPHRTVWIVPAQVKEQASDATGPVVLIISAASRQRLGDAFELVPLEIADRPFLRRDEYWAYLVAGPGR